MRRFRRVAMGLSLIGLGMMAGYSTRDSGARAAPSTDPVTIPPPSPAQLAEAHALGRTYAGVAAQLSPSVVRISVTQAPSRDHGSDEEDPFHGTPFERFFGRPRQKQHGLGSGVVIDKRGYILTNDHVVADAVDVKVSFVDGRTVPGKVVGTDPRSDLAVVRVDGVPVTPARLGDSDKMMVGEQVIAIGNPFGLDHTVTVGVLSAKNRAGFEAGQYEDFLQTDASINPGNSGGPLVNIDGEVVGINTMIAGIGTGIGFAVASSMAKPIAQQLIEHGKVRRPYVGILMQEVTPELQKSLGPNAPQKGALVTEVKSGSPADKAGVKVGDVVVSVAGAPTASPHDVQRAVLGKQVGERVDLGLWRAGTTVHVQVATVELPEEKEQKAEQGPAKKSRLGLALETLTPDTAHELGLPAGTHGAVVAAVDDGSPAADAGLREGDVILEIDQKPVATARDAQRALQGERSGGHLLRVRRGEGALFIVIPSRK